jgi:ATP-dependent DNA helicase RecG
MASISASEEVLNLGYHALQPHYHPLMVNYESRGKTILILWVPGGETRPYKARIGLRKGTNEWAFYIRKGSTTVRAKGADERELLTLAATVPCDDRYNQMTSLHILSKNS